MQRPLALCRFLVFAAALLLAPDLGAQLFRAYLAGDGSDANPCTLQQPCRLLPAALAAVASGGEIWLLDSANYNTATVTIGKSVTILAVPGVVGSVVATSGYAISIPTGSLKVTLRNLVIVPLIGSGFHGAWMQGDSVLTVENCLFANLPGYAIIVEGSGKLRVAGSTFRGSSGNAGLLIQNGATADVAGSQFLDNANGGILVYSGTAATTTVNVSDSIFSGNLLGVQAFANASGGVARAMVTRSTLQSGTYGVYSSTQGSGASAILTIGNCMITNNTHAWYQSGAGSVIRTMGNNQITDNNGTTTGSLALTPLQ